MKLFFSLWNCFYLYWATGDGLGNIAGYAPAGNGPFCSSWDNVYSFFFFLELLLLLEEASLGPPWRRVFPSVGGGGGTHCFLTLRVTNWFLFRETSSSWEDFHCQLSLQDHYKPAPDSKKIFFFLGFGGDRRVFHSILLRRVLGLLLLLLFGELSV